MALVGAGTLVVAAVLVFVLGDEGPEGGFRNQATATCTEFSDRIRREFALTFPEGAPSAAAEAEYLSRAFADTMDELVEALRALEPGAGATEAIDGLAARIDEIRAEPDRFVAAQANPFDDDVAPRFDALDLAACGSEFFAAAE